jgi:hypothetical protein
VIKNRVHLLWLFGLVATAAAEDLTIDSPRDYQVFPRQTRDRGRALIAAIFSSSLSWNASSAASVVYFF